MSGLSLNGELQLKVVKRSFSSLNHIINAVIGPSHMGA